MAEPTAITTPPGVTAEPSANGTAAGHQPYVPDSVTEPHFFTGEVDVTFDRVMNRALDELQITCRVLVGRADDQASQLVLDALLSGSGPASTRTAMKRARRQAANKRFICAR